jgi:hypothetical protein
VFGPAHAIHLSVVQETARFDTVLELAARFLSAELSLAAFLPVACSREWARSAAPSLSLSLDSSLLWLAERGLSPKSPLSFDSAPAPVAFALKRESSVLP